MRLLRLLSYFLGEASTSLRRSWRVSLLAVGIIAMSVFIGGAFLLLTENLSLLVGEWRRDARIIVYLRHEAGEGSLQRVREEVAALPWVTSVREISAAEAAGRFQELFPSLADLLEDWRGEAPLPASLELGFAGETLEPDSLASWKESLTGDPAVLMVDDDRDWLRQVETLVAVLGGLGLLIGVTLLVAATFIIAGVVRLTAYLYREEIEVMRLVGATELFIRGPFYCEGLMQGLLGGIVALGLLYLVRLGLSAQGAGGLLGSVVAERFLSPPSLAALLALGAAAGLVGAMISVRRESI